MTKPGRIFGWVFLDSKEEISMTTIRSDSAVNVISLVTATPVQSSQKATRSESPVSQFLKQNTAHRDAQVKDAVQHINETLQSLNTSLSFVTDSETGIKIVSVIDSATNSIIRQMPSEEVISVSRAVNKFQGLIIHQKA